MKKIFFKSLSVLLAAIMLLTQTHILSAKTIYPGLPGIDGSALILDLASLNAAMLELNELESYLDQNEGVTFQDLAATGNKLIVNVYGHSSPMGLDQDDDDLFGIPPFLWGCVLGWVGIVLVYVFTDNDKEKVKKAFTGCMVSGGVTVVVYVVYIVWLVNFLDTNSY